MTPEERCKKLQGRLSEAVRITENFLNNIDYIPPEALPLRIKLLISRLRWLEGAGKEKGDE